MPSVGEALLDEKVGRADEGAYLGELLVRQRIINHDVFDFASEFIKPGSLIVDACAGPEGSYLAATSHGHPWIGNDLSSRFAQTLARAGAEGRVIISDFAEAPYADKTAGAVFFVFALNNVCRMRKAIGEAARVLADEGVMVTADPGPSVWVGKIILLSLLENSVKGTLGKKCVDEIESYFAKKLYSLHGYVDYFLENSLGLTRAEMKEILRLDTEARQGKKYSPFHFQNLLARHHLLSIARAAGDNDLALARVGMLAAFKDSGAEWQVFKPVALDLKRDWMGQVIQARYWQEELTTKIPEAKVGVKAESRLVVPILVYKKKSA